MNYYSGDIILFRKKDYPNLFTTIKTLDLDNDIGIVVINFKNLEGVYILQISKTINVFPINNYQNTEFYQYRQDDISITNEILLEKLKLNPTSTLELVNYLYGIKDFYHIRANHSMIHSNNSGVFHFDNDYINPYALTYLTLPFFEYLLAKNLTKKRIKKVKNFNFIFWLLVIFGMISGRIMSVVNNNPTGMRFVGAMFVFYFVILVIEYLYDYPTLKILDMLTLIIGFRIFFTRFASWLINDINVKTDPNTGLPYDVLLYESIFEGLLPTLLCWIIKDRVQDGHLLLLWVFTYSFFRLIIEQFKDSYHNTDFVLTQGQIDVIPLIFLTLWIYITRKHKRKSYNGFIIIVFLYLDLCARAQGIKKTQAQFMNVDVIFKKTKNYGFIDGVFSNISPIQKLMINSTSLLISLYFTKDYEKKLLLLLASSLNLGERSLSGYVTDYFSLKIPKVSSLNMNISDLIINLI
jgi:prolipoprotein diacylglyceryltransferase